MAIFDYVESYVTDCGRFENLSDLDIVESAYIPGVLYVEIGNNYTYLDADAATKLRDDLSTWLNA